MKKLTITKKQETFLKNFKEIPDVTLLLFIKETTIGGFIEFDDFTEEERALIWMGHYDVELEPLDELLSRLEVVLNSSEVGEHKEGYIAGLQFAIAKLSPRKIMPK